MRAFCPLALFGMAIGLGQAVLWGQRSPDTVEAHVIAAKKAAGTDFRALFALCTPDPPDTGATAASPLPWPPPRSEWHVEPA
jgi:hypothetical protein